VEHLKKIRGIENTMNWSFLKSGNAKEKSYSSLMNFKKYKDFENGVIECKDGALMAALSYTGVDSETSSATELNYISHRLNTVLKTYGSGWCLWTDVLRLPVASYPDRESCHFPDDISLMIDEERRTAVEEQEDHYQSVLFAVLMYKTPSKTQSKIADVVVDDTDGGRDRRTVEEITYNKFISGIDNLSANFPEAFGVSRVTPYVDAGIWYCDFLRHLNYCSTGVDRPVRVPSPDFPLDLLISGQDFYHLLSPIVGEKMLGVLSVVGLAKFTEPAFFGFLDHLPLQYRWSTRFIFNDSYKMIAKLESTRRKWKQRVKSLKDQIVNTENPTINQDAVDMVAESDRAISQLSSGETGGGYHSSVIIIYANDEIELENSIQYITQEVARCGGGIGIRHEGVNATEAFLGTIPGNVYPNIARYPISTKSLSDLIPVSSQWPGEEYCSSPFFPDKSPPLIQCETVGSTPFRLNLHVIDIGHTFVAGETGTGKSTLLAVIAAQWRKYKDSRVFCFDSGMSMFALTQGVGGNHYEIGSDERPVTFMPLNDIDSPAGLAWAQEWCELCLTLVGHEVGPESRKKIGEALKLLKESSSRTITEFVCNIQDKKIRDAFHYYTIDGPAGHIMDQNIDNAELGDFNTFEVSELMGLGDKIVLPTLSYIFKRIEKMLDGKPTLIILDEVWLLFEHPYFLEMIKKWLKTVRKANGAVVMATQSLLDAKNSSMMEVIMGSCATKILLPHPSVLSEANRPLFIDTLRLNERELLVLANGVPKREYFYFSPLGKRMFQLNLRPKTLAFVGRGSKEDIARIKELMELSPENWREKWLEEAA